MEQEKTISKQKNPSAIRNAYVNYLSEECGFHGKTLIHYPDAVDKYMPKYIKSYLNPNFKDFYSITVGGIKSLYIQLEKSKDWEKEINYKTWNLRMKAIEHFIAFKELHLCD